MRYLLSFAVCIVFIFGSITPSRAQPLQPDDGYTLEEVLAAYEAGQFRTIYTRGRWLYASADGAYIYSSRDGTYRVSDGRYIGTYGFFFSPDSQYAIENHDGIYRLSDGVEVIDLTYATYSDLTFSDDGQYVAIQRYGVYRLDDGQHIIDSLNRGFTFSPDSSLVATWDGIYRVSDGIKLFESEEYSSGFSPDGTYAWGDALYRLSDNQAMFDITTTWGVWFSPDMQYAVVPGDGVYRLNDGQRLYDRPELLPYMGRVRFSANSEFMAIDGAGVYRLSDGEKLFDLDRDPYITFSPDSSLVALDNDGVYRLSDRTKLFNITGSNTYFTPDGAYFADSDAIYRVADGEMLFDRGVHETEFSPNGEYVAIDFSGVYRLSDQQELFYVERVNGFSEDEEYLYGGPYRRETNIYRISDGHCYRGLEVLNVSAGILAIGSTALIIDPARQGERLPVIFVLQEEIPLYEGPGEQYPSRKAVGLLYHVVLANQHGWYLVNTEYGAGWLNPADDIEFFYAPG